MPHCSRAGRALAKRTCESDNDEQKEALFCWQLLQLIGNGTCCSHESGTWHYLEHAAVLRRSGRYLECFLTAISTATYQGMVERMDLEWVVGEDTAKDALRMLRKTSLPSAPQGQERDKLVLQSIRELMNLFFFQLAPKAWETILRQHSGRCVPKTSKTFMFPSQAWSTE